MFDTSDGDVLTPQEKTEYLAKLVGKALRLGAEIGLEIGPDAIDPGKLTLGMVIESLSPELESKTGEFFDHLDAVLDAVHEDLELFDKLRSAYLSALKDQN